MREAARFTLSELLLTIVIIMLLFSLAAAAAGSAQGSSKAAGCADNCRRMGMAFHTYANDFEGLHGNLWVNQREIHQNPSSVKRQSGITAPVGRFYSVCRLTAART